MTTTNDLLMQDIVFLIKRCLENSFYCESLDLCQEVPIKINRTQLIHDFSDDEIMEAFDTVTSLSRMVQNSMIRFFERISFSSESIYFSTYQFYINELEKVDFNLIKLIENLNSK